MITTLDAVRGEVVTSCSFVTIFLLLSVFPVLLVLLMGGYFHLSDRSKCDLQRILILSHQQIILVIPLVSRRLCRKGFGQFCQKSVAAVQHVAHDPLELRFW
jgi:hypothetical protein